MHIELPFRAPGRARPHSSVAAPHVDIDGLGLVGVRALVRDPLCPQRTRPDDVSRGRRCSHKAEKRRTASRTLQDRDPRASSWGRLCWYSLEERARSHPRLGYRCYAPYTYLCSARSFLCVCVSTRSSLSTPSVSRTLDSQFQFRFSAQATWTATFTRHLVLSCLGQLIVLARLMRTTRLGLGDDARAPRSLLDAPARAYLLEM
ncbi:hypothetical protein C8R45DRAFT_969382 [Mycena sanguinolenta]|nr:hypothetical protein C8R45DRAFT_969382 [Mycena sanguinolenta]